MHERKRALLGQIIKQHIKTALPVGSKLLSEKGKVSVSSATIRNEMSQLESEGYITHPHTSAGRIPTEKGYRFYLENLIKTCQLSSKEQKALKNHLTKLKSEELEVMIKKLAREIVEISNNTVLIGFSNNHVYYTGIANLLIKPEFNDPSCLYDMGLIVDHLDKVMEEIFEQINELEVRIGSENPFGQECSVILVPWQIKRRKGVIGILGPMRMDYEHNIGLINYIMQNI